jgi:hypothetical protein
MKRVEYWLWLTWNDLHTRRTQTRYRMTEEVAMARHPDAIKVEGTCEVRELAETEAEHYANTISPPSRGRR